MEGFEVGKHYKSDDGSSLRLFKPTEITHFTDTWGYQLHIGIGNGRELFIFSKTFLLYASKWIEIPESEFNEIAEKCIKELNTHFTSDASVTKMS